MNDHKELPDDPSARSSEGELENASSTRGASQADFVDSGMLDDSLPAERSPTPASSIMTGKNPADRIQSKKTKLGKIGALRRPASALAANGDVSPRAAKAGLDLKGWILGRFDTPAAQGLVFAGFWYRFLAFVIDFPLSLVIAIGALTVLQMMLPVNFLSLNTVAGNTTGMILIQVAFFVIAEQSSWKATPGKRLLKLRVTDKRGQRMGIVRALARTLLKVTIPITFGAVVIFMFFSLKHQTLYDKMSSSLVLRKSTEEFLPRFLPPAVRRRHWMVVVAISLLLSSSIWRAGTMVMEPRLELMALRSAVVFALKDLSKAQKSIEASLASEGKLPSAIDPSLFEPSQVRRHLYQASSGSLTMMFQAGPLKGRGLMLTPNKDASSGEVLWACAAINLPANVTPDSCAATEGAGGSGANLLPGMISR